MDPTSSLTYSFQHWQITDTSNQKTETREKETLPETIDNLQALLNELKEKPEEKSEMLELFNQQVAVLHVIVTSRLEQYKKDHFTPGSPKNKNLNQYEEKLLENARAEITKANYSKAQTYLDGILRSKPENYDALCLNIICLSKLDKTQKALEQLINLEKLHPGDPWVLGALGVALYDSYLEFNEIFLRKVVEIEIPKETIEKTEKVKELLGIGKIFFLKHDYQYAHLYFEKILKIEPDHEEANGFYNETIGHVTKDNFEEYYEEEEIDPEIDQRA